MATADFFQLRIPVLGHGVDFDLSFVGSFPYELIQTASNLYGVLWSDPWPKSVNQRKDFYCL